MGPPTGVGAMAIPFKLFGLCLLGSGCLALARPANAAPAPASAGYCSGQDEEVSEARLAQLRTRLILLSSVRHARLAHTIGIENEGDSPELAPYYDRPLLGGAPVIRIPRGFVRLQCQLLLIRFNSDAKALFDGLGTDRAIEACRNGPQPLDCVRALFTRAALLAESQRPLTDGFRLAFPEALDAALVMTLLHEFAHVALGHRSTAELSRGLRQEGEADLYALVRAAAAGNAPWPAFLTFSTLSIVDRQFQQANNVHGRFACRAAISGAIISALARPISDLHGWLTGDAMPLAETAPPILGETSNCPSALPPRVARIREDLGRMTGVLAQRLSPEMSEAAFEDRIRALLAVQLATPEARRLRMTLITVGLGWARSDLRSMQSGRLGALIRLALAREPSRMLFSEDYGRLLGFETLLAYRAAPPGSSLDAVNARFGPGFRTAVYHHPEFGFGLLNLGRIAYMSRRCAEGLAFIERFVAQLPDPDGGRVEYRDMLGPMDPARCAATTQAERERARSRYRWR